MEITEGIKIIDLALYIKRTKTLVISDVHLGVEGEMQKKGVLVPKFHMKDLMTHFEYIFSQVKPKKIIITGDLKHDFSGISEQEWRDLLRFFDYLSKHSEKIVLLKGNHDPFLGPIAKKRNLELVKEYVSGSVLFVHGDYEPELKKSIKTIIMGHEHPAVVLREKTKSEKFKCFLKSKYKGRTLLVLPSLNMLSEGTDVLQGRFLSPLLKKNDFDIFIVEKFEAYDFGNVKKFLK